MTGDRTTEGIRLSVYLTEDDWVEKEGADTALVRLARDAGLAGATVWRGVEGLGRHGRLRTAQFPDATVGMPLIVELIDVPEHIDAFVPTVFEVAPGALVTREAVRIEGPGLTASG